MSVWTHVNGSIRIDGIPCFQPDIDEKIVKSLGKTCDYESNRAAWDACSVPCGSEGSIQYAINDAGDGLVYKTVAIWGDLRDYEDIGAIEKWFRGICESGLMIRQAVIQVECRDRKVVFAHNHNDDEATA